MKQNRVKDKKTKIESYRWALPDDLIFQSAMTPRRVDNLTRERETKQLIALYQTLKAN